MPWSGYVVPARAPREIVMRLNTEINRALVSPTITERFTAMGSLINGGTPEQFAEHVRKETEKWGKVIRTAGIRVD
jgi:tripartite-type tricarboxylate transporter receptor subunit TctC